MKPGGRGQLVLTTGIKKGNLYVHGPWVTVTASDEKGNKVRTTYPISKVVEIRWSSS